MNSIIQPKTKKELKKIINEEIKLNGLDCDLNHLDTSLINNMSKLFFQSLFNGDISKWNVSKVTNMEKIFSFSEFNQDISQWNVSNVKNMNFMFYKSQFNQFLENWKPKKIQFCSDMFSNCNTPIPYWYSENTDEIKEKIKKYEEVKILSDKLDNSLDKNKSNTKKIK